MIGKINKNNIKGFTLLELLLVMTLTSIILFGLSEAYFIIKKLITHYHQTIRLQTNIRLMTHEIYKISTFAGQLGCAHTKLPLYLHWSKSIDVDVEDFLYFEKQKLVGLAFLNPLNSKVTSMLPKSLYSRLNKNSAIIYTLHALSDQKPTNSSFYPVYADCQDIFVLSPEDDPSNYFEKMPHLKLIGDLEVNLYFIANTQRKNNQSFPIYSLYRYNAYVGAQQIIEGVECIDFNSNAATIKILLTSVEGKPPLKQWLTISL